jgi:stage II sporulation protein D
VVVAGIGACVSLSPPGGGRSDVPVVRGIYRNGREQLVRIALATTGTSGTATATGDWNILEGPAERSAASLRANEEITLGTSSTGSLSFSRNGAVQQWQMPVVVHAGSINSLVIWGGKQYRGDLIITASDSGMLVVNRLPMDAYLRGVVPLEIGNRTSAEIAAVESQAVAARTYAYKHLNNARAFDMYATVQDQVYGGVAAEKPLSDSAIVATQDVVVLYGGQPITTPYHSTCGGSTAGVTEVWYDQPDEPYLRPVSDRIPGTDKFYCDSSPRFSWTQTYDAAGLRAVMEKYLANYTNAPKTNLGRITEIREQGRTQSGRVAALRVQTESGSYTLRGNDIRFVLRDPKGAILNSTLFNLSTSTNGGEVSSLTVNGRGYGHGIGMCQWGAIGRARAGQNYRTILETYYPGTTIGRIGS